VGTLPVQYRYMTFFTFDPLISGPDGPANGRVPAGRDHQLYRHPLQGGGEQGDLTLLYLYHVISRVAYWRIQTPVPVLSSLNEQIKRKKKCCGSGMLFPDTGPRMVIPDPEPESRGQKSNNGKR
jgi:hypothetical protein